jgi:hypothetical protein
LPEQYFPDTNQLRNAIAHVGANDVLSDENAPEHGYLLVGFKEQDRFRAPYQGVDRHLTISEDSSERIREVASEFLLALEPSAKLLVPQGHLD